MYVLCIKYILCLGIDVSNEIQKIFLNSTFAEHIWAIDSDNHE